ncbi:MAG: insulinase family protein [Porphyrobacter sp. IPPAS B-1204]|nr:MAG: insulinase family protein [Porphyrobacter sp. IPPAS B-1204]
MGRTTIRFCRAVSPLAMVAGLALAAAPAVLAQEAAPQLVTVIAGETSGLPAWGIPESDFPADPDITFGRLPNGMRYALMRNSNPKGEAAIRFTIAVGAREESDAENGAAHFVEHMAFNGSTGIPEGRLLPMLEKLGLAFGADTNAETGLDYTTYKLQLPRTDDETVSTALKVIREMAGELTFDPAAVDRERGIILNEAQVRNDPGRRRIAHFLQAALPGSRVGERVRADVERIRNITPAQLRAFYHAYYRPERATLAIVGDFDVAAMEARIKASFADWQGQGPAREAYRSPLPAGTGAPAIAAFVDSATPEIVELQRISAWQPYANTLASAREDYLRAIGAFALSNRINALSRGPESPTLGGGASDEPLFRSAKSFGLSAVAKDGQWAEALALAEREIRRAAEFGFTSAEIAEAKANLVTDANNAVAQAAGRFSADLAEELVEASLDNEVPTSPAFNLTLYQAVEASLTPEAVSEAFRAAWQGGPTVVHVSTKQPIAGETEAIAAVLAQSAAVAVTAPAEEAEVQWAYGEWGAPGKVVADTTIADLGIRTVRFANGLQLNLKLTDFEPGKVVYSMRVGGGLARFPRDREGLRELLPVVASIDGLEQHSVDELRRVLAGKVVGNPFDGEIDALVADGQTTPADLKLQLDLLGARLTATGWRPEAAAQLAGIGPIVVEQVKADAVAVMSLSLGSIMAGGDARSGLENADALAQISLEDVRAVIAPQLAEGPVALGLVGDFDPDAAIAAVAATLGALPAREVRGETLEGTAPVRFTADRATRVITHKGAADQGVLALGWPTTDASDQRDDYTRDLLAAVMSLRLTEKLREELGSTYSPEAFSYTHPSLEGFGYLAAYATVPPEAMDETAATIRAIAAELAAQPPAADLFERARNPIRANFERAETQNGGWLAIVAKAQSDPSLLDRRRRRIATLDAITPADVQAAAQRYLAGGVPVELRVVPEAP